ncbi:aminotransferase class I/II-fold pyridoxal phosphate-dependent enzyme [Amphibacillus cookii]|uniref:aminotransferase class I/II-fold pyridoxal phosphate-dependent enzyme n=1 Tax=Amphibacillus cookii TaxID=767787 RepID=UPI00195B27D0|nr:aminotransferase class I/II-fold pyridoxal phosphate-dependent enzyme [Amphibacillus cookii]MBM7540409.1 aminotransferase [Amphibacillus cookii]
MKNSINQTIKNIEISGIRKFFNLVNEREDILSLTIGQPDFSTPNVIKAAAKKAIDNDQTTYTANAGLPVLREAVANYLNEKNQLSIDMTQVLITVGASQAIDIACRALLNKGDEVILPNPVYPGYQPLIELAGAKPVHIDTRATDFKLTAALIEKNITEHTKCVILPYPSNPTGVTLSKQELIEIADVIDKHNLYIITDEIYSTLTYEGSHYSLARQTQIKDRVIVINGLSKSHAMTGWRIGFLIAPHDLVTDFTKVLQYNVSCASSISQHAAFAAVTLAKDEPDLMKHHYQKRRDYVHHRLLSMGLEVVKPDGAFYFMFRLQGDKSTFELAMDIVDKVGLALVPGDAFGTAGEGYLRLSYAYDMETLTEGLDRLERYIKTNH